MTKEKTERKTNRKKKGKRGQERRIVWVEFIFLALLCVVGIALLKQDYRMEHKANLSEIEIPDWIDRQLLDKNVYSRPATTRKEINDIVVHYVANPGTSAMANRNYFNGLADQDSEAATSASSHFIIGIDGEILQIVPLDEFAYANYPRNEDTVSIECCHPDSTGEFTEATKESLAKLVAWLCQELDLTERNVIRHYDVIGKNCPKYYVQDEQAWKELKKLMKKKRKEL